MAWWFLLGELRGIAVLAGIWLASAGRDTRTRRFRVYRLRQRWAAWHLGGVRKLFGLTFEIEGLEHAAPGPVVILMRHASYIDNMLPDAVVGRTHGLGLRFVLKRELRLLPTIDIGGGWVPTAFVHRGSGDTERELAELRRLALDLEPEEGILIYPEGTIHTPAKRARAQEIIRERQPELAPLADRLRHTLPPRLGGALALLDGARGADVVVFAHAGFDGFGYLPDIWAGGLAGATIRLRFWRHGADEVPADRDDLVRWLYARWQEVDDWIADVSWSA
jgi:1-acyl-sn-glycerol-3-phosphate acyltransferase